MGQPLGRHPGPHPHARSIVAVLRDGDVIASPGPTFVLQAGDMVVAVGASEGLDRLVRIIDGD